MIEKMLQHLKHCDLCPRQCGADRTRGELGWCRAGLNLELAYVGPHHGEEPPISGTRGSGTIFACQCTMGCVFCQNWQISQGKKNDRGTQRSSGFSSIRNCHNVNLVSPTQYLPQLLNAVKEITLPIVYNTNGYERVEILRELDGVVAIYLPDMKYSDNVLAKKYSKTSDYVEYNQAALREMFRQVGLLQVDEDGIAIRGLIVRHLVLPGQLDNSKRCLDFIAGLSTEMTVSIMAQYSPQYQAERFPELNRKLDATEYAEIVDYAHNLGLKNCFVQELESQNAFVPNFSESQPFENQGSPAR